MALNAKTENATLNVKLGSDDGSERRNWECDSERQIEKQWWLWTPKLRSDNDGFECRNWKCDEDDSEHRNWEVMALNTETEKRWWWLWTPKLKNVTLNVKLKIDDGSEHRNWECDSEHQTKGVALKAKLKMALDIELKTNNEFERQTEDMTLNAKMTMRL